MTFTFTRQVEIIKTIRTWDDYSNQLQVDKCVYKAFQPLMSIPITKPRQQCGHIQFEQHPHSSMAQLIEHFMLNDCSVGNTLFLESQLKTAEWKLCAQCIHKLLINTNGLNNTYSKWVTNAQISLRYRAEFFYTNIIVNTEPLLIKALLDQRNIACLSKIFKLFFITYLKTNLKQFIANSNEIVKEDRVPHSFAADSLPKCFAIKGQHINACFGFEHAFAKISTTIIC